MKTTLRNVASVGCLCLASAALAQVDTTRHVPYPLEMSTDEMRKPSAPPPEDAVTPRIRADLRMQHSADQPPGLPRPPDKQMPSVAYQSDPDRIDAVFERNSVSVDLPQAHRDRAKWQFYVPGTADAPERVGGIARDVF